MPANDKNMSGDMAELDYHKFSHKAMATVFEIFIAQQEANYARQATAEAFALLDRVEQQISRFVENSDITRLNTAPVNQEVLLRLDSFACLSKAMELRTITQGAFDVTMGTLTAQQYHNAQEDKPYGLSISAPSLRKKDAELLTLDEDGLTATRLVSDVQIDLGGIGKGFVLDRMAEVLKQWGIDRALLHGGSSSVLALDGPAEGKAWPVTMSCPLERNKTIVHLPLANCALGGSSQIDQKHIIDPRTGRLTFARVAAWSHSPDAATADGLSTAFMLLSDHAIADLFWPHPGTAAPITFTDDGQQRPCKIEPIGNWPAPTPKVWCRCEA